jgi:hypothetical protein
MNALRAAGDQWALAAPMKATWGAPTRPGWRSVCTCECGIYLSIFEATMSSQVELCEHHAKDCLQAAERAEDPVAREMLLRHALEWMQGGLAASKQSQLCAVCGRKTAPGSTLVH